MLDSAVSRLLAVLALVVASGLLVELALQNRELRADYAAQV